MPRTRRSKNSSTTNKRNRPSSGPNSPSKQQSQKRSRTNGTTPPHLRSQQQQPQPTDHPDYETNEHRNRIEEYEEEGYDLQMEEDNDPPTRIPLEEENDDDDEDDKKEKDQTNNNNQKKKKKTKWTYGNLDIASMTETDERPLRIYLDGVFDLTHFGHFRLFKQVKDKFPNSTIVVGVAGDEDTCRLKGQTVFDQAERSETISHCKWVDEVICPCPWIVTQSFMDEKRLDYIAHDDAPYVSAGQDDIYKFVKDQGRFIATQRTEGVSTTGLINRIVRRYNEYVIRNLQRGVTRQDLNVSWTRVQRIRAEQKLKENAQFMAENFKKFTEDPDEFISGFLAMFGPGGRIRKRFTEKIEEMREEFVEYAQFAPM